MPAPAAATSRARPSSRSRRRSPSTKGAQLVFLLKQNHGGWNSDDLMTNNLGRFRLSYTAAADPVADPLPKAVREILSIPREKRSPAQIDAVFSYLAHDRPRVQGDQREDRGAREAAPGAVDVADGPRRPASEMRDTRLLKRGDWLKPGKAIKPGVPAVLHPLPANAPPTRLTFARWLVDPKSPTTARAFVNRVWQTYFGTGLVATSEDFGTQSEAPSHPELLDWLAVEFMENGWSLKDLHRLIVTSATYRQTRASSHAGAVEQGSRTTGCSPAARASASKARSSATSRWRPAGC